MTDQTDLLLVNEFHPETIARLDGEYRTHKLWEIDSKDRIELINSLSGKCSAAASASWELDPVVYELESLQFIAAFGVGVDGIDFGKTRARGIRVSNTPDVLNDAVADLALAMILAGSRNLINADAFARQGDWLQGPFPFGRSLQGKTLGIAGLGRIGQAVAERALPFGLNIAYHNRRQTDSDFSYHDSLESLARASDILLGILPGGESTRGLFNRKIFRALGPEGLFINIGRGSSVVEEELAQSLAEKEIAAAALDVYENEPRIPASLTRLDNIILLPHIGSATLETRRAMGQLVIDNLAAYFNGSPLLTEVQD